MQKIILVLVTAFLGAQLCIAQELSFSGTVLDDAVEVDFFGSDVEIGDVIGLKLSVDLTAVPPGQDIVLPGLSGALTLYNLNGLGDIQVDIGAVAYTCPLLNLSIGDNVVFPPSIPSPLDYWMVGAGDQVFAPANCPNLLFVVELSSSDTTVLTDTNLFLPVSLNGFTGSFRVLKTSIDPAGSLVAEVTASGSIDSISPSLELLAPALAQALVEAGLPSRLSDAPALWATLPENSVIRTLEAAIIAVQRLAAAGRITDAQLDEIVALAEVMIDLLEQQ